MLRRAIALALRCASTGNGLSATRAPKGGGSFIGGCQKRHIGIDYRCDALFRRTTVVGQAAPTTLDSATSNVSGY
jgi:hypothetical protein